MKAQPTMLKNLFDLQAELKPIGKNADGYQYRYADLEQVWNKIHNLIHKYNFVVYHSIKKSGVKTIAWHESGDKLSSFIPFGGELKPQDKGSEITYYKRYNIGAIFNLIIAGEDDDANSSQKNQEPFKGDEYADDNLNVAPPLSERIAKYSDMEKLKYLLNKMGGDSESSALLLLGEKTGLKFDSFKEMTKTQTSNAFRLLSKLNK